MDTVLIFIIIPYLIGSIPFGLILTKLFGYGDIRNIGSGNIGATNVMRTGNKKLAIATLLLDGLKGYAALKVADLLTHSYDSMYLFMASISVLLGHIYPCWLKFKGGKGVATAIGVLFFLNGLLALTVMSIWLVTFYFSRISSLSALTALALATLLSPFYAGHVTRTVIVITLIIFYTHRENIKRLMRGEEHKWRKP